MYDSTKTSGRKKRWAGAVGLLAAGAISGGALASTLSARVQTGPFGAAPTAGPHTGGCRVTAALRAAPEARADYPA